MIKAILIFTALLAVPVVQAQAQAQMPAAGPVCPAGMTYATIRHSMVLPGKWAAFEKAVASHQAWYASHGNATTTTISRILPPRNSADKALLESEAVTITQYDNKKQPAHDAGWAAFTADYKASSTIKEEMRVCMPAMAH